jgi:HSP20 family molecular chaperone IbpA
MSGEWRKRRKRPWFDIFVEFKEIEKIMDEMMQQVFSKSKRFRPHVYGFSVTIGSDGTPRIREFGNVQKSLYGPRIMEQREPLVDVLDEEEEVVVVAELPGVKKEDINIYLSKGGLLSAWTPRNGNTTRSCHSLRKWTLKGARPPTRMASSRYDSKRRAKEKNTDSVATPTPAFAELKRARFLTPR